MGPSNDRERAIAKVVDQIAIEGRLKLISIQEATNVLGFIMTASENCIFAAVHPVADG